MTRKFPLLLAGLIGLSLTTGCGPVPQPVWNHDSRSFFYTKSDGTIAQYDLEKGGSRTLLAAGDQRPSRVALSATFPKVFLAQAAIGEKGWAVQAAHYSLAENRIAWSKLEVWGDKSASREACSTACYASADGQRVLIWYQKDLPTAPDSNPEFLGRFAVYDVPSGTLKELTTIPPAVFFAQAINLSPLCPDGSGYLAMKWIRQEPSLYFVSWDGWEYPIEIDPSVQSQPPFPKGDTKGSESEKDEGFLLPQGEWRDQAIECPTPAGILRIDLKARKINCLPLSASQAEKFEQIAAADVKDTPWFTLQAVPFESGRYALHCRVKRGDHTVARIELVDTEMDRRKILMTGGLPENICAHHLLPSPDGRLILVCLRNDRRNWIYVVSSGGEILVKVDAGPFRQIGG